MRAAIQRTLTALQLVMVVVVLTMPSDTAQVAARPHVTDGPSSVLARHADDCWRGSQPPLAAVPGHVIWQRPSGVTTYSARLVGPALNTTFGDGHLAGTPIAFCR